MAAPSYDAIWQVGAAIQLAYGAGPSRPMPSGIAAERDSLIDRAVATNDEHAIKFTEACLRQHGAIPAALQRFPDDRLGEAGIVDVRRIEKIDAPIEAGADHVDCGGFIGLTAKCHRAEAHARDNQIGVLESAGFHGEINRG